MKYTHRFTLAALIGSAFLFAITGCDSGKTDAAAPAGEAQEDHVHESGSDHGTDSSHDAAMPNHGTSGDHHMDGDGHHSTMPAK